ncbi:MAG: class I SAM-dependent methyltransferase [Lachnospiraceae bacterium]|nr:class I SAM-dependent methyltransferase [Lachnospiraceae bacterium]
MRLSKRLLAVAGLVPKGSAVADIGCDHGYVSIYLLQQEIAKSVIAMDIKQGPLDRAKENIKDAALTDRIELRLSDGAEALQPGEADTLIMAGMGGRLTLSIVEGAIEKLGETLTFILQPQSEVPLVRRRMRELGYGIEDEDFVAEDGKFYPMMRFTFTGEKASEAAEDTPYLDEEIFGPVLLKKRPPDFELYLSKEKEKIEEILAHVTDEERREELKDYLCLLSETDRKG